MKLVTIGIVFFKEEKYLPYMIFSLLQQDYPNIEILIKDNSEKNQVNNFFKKHFPEILLNKKIKIFIGENNKHSRGHNELINKMKGDYYVCASSDMYYEKNVITEIIKQLEKSPPGYGGATCKIRYWDFEKLESVKIDKKFSLENQAKLIESSKTNIIDSCGICTSDYLYAFDLGQGEEDQGQYDTNYEIFGASGALVVFRKEVLEKIALVKKLGSKEYFHPKLHYKNDVEISWRCKVHGYRFLFVPQKLVYHARKVSSFSKKFSNSIFYKIFSKNKFTKKIYVMLFSRSSKSEFVKISSYQGYFFIFKNYFQYLNFYSKCKALLFYIMIIFYLVCFEFSVFKKVRSFI